MTNAGATSNLSGKGDSSATTVPPTNSGGAGSVVALVGKDGASVGPAKVTGTNLGIASTAVSLRTAEITPAKGSAGTVGVVTAHPTNSIDKGLPAPPSPYGDVYVVSVGANGAGGPGLPSLRFAAADAIQFTDVLAQRYGFTNSITLTNSSATRGAIGSTLDRLRSTLANRPDPQRDADVFFFFSGHGATVPEVVVSGGQTNVLRHGFLIPHDSSLGTNSGLAELRAGAIEMRWLAEQMISLRARHRLVFLDACFSGLAFVESSVIKHSPVDLYRDVIQKPTVQIMTAGLDQEVAYEDVPNGHGVFTEALLDQIGSRHVLTMEEVFIPARVGVRNRLQGLGQPNAMTPQHRFLLYQNGTFVFVPLEQLTTWATVKPSNPQSELAAAKGYFRPVELTEVTNVLAASTMPPEKWQSEVDRYEARASMGDANATLALAEIYSKGLGVPKDPRRARLYTQESSDYFTAAGTLNLAGLAGIKNPVAAALLNNLVSVNGGAGALGGLPALGGGIPVAGHGGNPAGIAAFSLQMASIFGGNGGGIGGMEGTRLEVIRFLGERKYKEADRRLSEFERQLGELSAKVPTGVPAEFQAIKDKVSYARQRIALSLPASARRALEEVSPLIDSIKKQIPVKEK